MNSTKIERLVWAVALLFVAAPAVWAVESKEVFQEQVSVGFGQFEDEITFGGSPLTPVTATTGFVSARFYPLPVKVRDNPIVEAPFLEHASFVGLGLGWTRTDLTDADGPSYSLEGSFASQNLPFLASLTYAHVEFDDEATGDDWRSNRWSAQAGIYLKRNRAVTVVMTDRRDLDRNSRVKTDLSSVGLVWKEIVKTTWRGGIGFSLGFFWMERARLQSMSFDEPVWDATNSIWIDERGGGWVFAGSVDIFFSPLAGVGGGVRQELLPLQTPPAAAEDRMVTFFRAFYNTSTQFGVQVEFESNDEDDDTSFMLSVVGRL